MISTDYSEHVFCQNICIWNNYFKQGKIAMSHADCVGEEYSFWTLAIFQPLKCIFSYLMEILPSYDKIIDLLDQIPI